MSPPTELRRVLSLPVITFYGMGTIIGAGIYVLVGEIAGAAGMRAPLAFALAGVIAAFTALSYAELSSRYPVSAGEAVYLEQGFGRRWLSMGVGLLLAVAGMVSSATLANGFVGYLRVFVPTPDWLAVIGLVLALGTLACWGIRESAIVATVTTLVEIGGLVLILIVAAPNLAHLPQRLPEMLPSADAAAWSGVLLGAFLAFYAFLGFEDMVNVAEEVRDPARNMPRAILIAAAVATVLYVLVATAAVLTQPPERLALSEAPLASIYVEATGRSPWVISVVGLFAVVNGALIQIIMGARILYGMAREGWLPRALADVHPRTRTPLATTALMTAAVLVLALWFPLVTLAKATSFILLSVFALVNLALVRIKLRGPAPAGVRTFPLWVPVAGLVLCLAILAFQTLA
jgi:APA family basic amino acid/polyamine antiporter